MAANPEYYMFSVYKMKQVLNNAITSLRQAEARGIKSADPVFTEDAIVELVRQCARDRANASINGGDALAPCSNHDWMAPPWARK